MFTVFFLVLVGLQGTWGGSPGPFITFLLLAKRNHHIPLNLILGGCLRHTLRKYSKVIIPWGMLNLLPKFKSVSDDGGRTGRQNLKFPLPSLTFCQRPIGLCSHLIYLALELPRDLRWCCAVTGISPGYPWSPRQNFELTPTSTENWEEQRNI